ncbi:hypothetical protein BMS3Bbin04_00511 [bacterium BMS3Bbin04]|nr:hypothetical protein BMS3Bbin04_00511 [bacterium BMS3Bbin04]
MIVAEVFSEILCADNRICFGSLRKQRLTVALDQ